MASPHLRSFLLLAVVCLCQLSITIAFAVPKVNIPDTRIPRILGESAKVETILSSLGDDLLPISHLDSYRSKTSFYWGKGDSRRTSFYWEKDGERIPEEAIAYKSLGREGDKVSILWLFRLDKHEDFGVYTFRIGNRNGLDEQEVFIYEYDPPVTTTSRPYAAAIDEASIIGKNTIIECAVTSHPMARIVWKRNGQKVSYGNGKYRRESLKSGDFLAIERLEIASVGEEDLGHYTCEAQINLERYSRPVYYDDLSRPVRQTTISDKPH